MRFACERVGPIVEIQLVRVHSKTLLEARRAMTMIGAVAELLSPDFVVREGVLCLAGDADCAQRSQSAYGTVTAVEASCTHVHVLDHFEHGAGLDTPAQGPDGLDLFYDFGHPDFRAACEIGLAMVYAWAGTLTRSFAGSHFRIYYSERDNPVVRCHRVRPGEDPWLPDEEVANWGGSGRVVVLDTRDWRLVDSDPSGGAL